MKKEKIPLSRLGGEPFFIDVCQKCRMVWFNGGELAKLQLDYEMSDQAIEELDHQLRLAQRTPEEAPSAPQVGSDREHNCEQGISTSKRAPIKRARP